MMTASILRRYTTIKYIARSYARTIKSGEQTMVVILKIIVFAVLLHIKITTGKEGN